MNSAMWQFWIDVGGTFTDCVARRPDGSLLRHKVLSSGIVKGRIGSLSTAAHLVDVVRSADPPNHWRGYGIRLLDADGTVLAESTIAASDPATGTLQLLDRRAVSGASYELFSDEEAPLIAIRYLLGLRRDQPLPPVVVRLGTTRGTNALLTRAGASAGFVTTRGFGDILRIGNQDRPKLFDLNIRKPTPLFSAVVEIDERVTWDGRVLLPLDEDQTRRELTKLRHAGIDSLAICLLNAYAIPEHERRVAAIARELGFAEISVSHEVAPVMKIVSRGDTTVVDAYLNPVLRSYLNKLKRSLSDADGGTLRCMTSAGGLVGADRFTGKDSILSGPAGGVVGFSRVAAQAGFARAIGFDMGGTSTDVSRFDGRYELEYETTKAGVRVVAPLMAIETVAAGGGSICRFDGVKLVVGPESAGANPGPACYGRGGPLTVTDVNLFLGRLLAEHFPFPLDRDAVARRLNAIAADVEQQIGQRPAALELAEGFQRIANTNMAAAIRTISVAKGYDPRDYVLVSFGGAAAQHACAVAAELGMTSILSHPDASVLSALGNGLADVTRHRVAGVYQLFATEQFTELAARFTVLEAELVDELLREGVPRERIELQRALELRYRGLDASLTVLLNDGFENAPRDYEATQQRLFGYVQHNRPIEIVALRVEAVGQADVELPRSQRCSPVVVEPTGKSSACVAGRFQEVPVFQRERLLPGALITGPAIIVETNTTTIVDPGWTAAAYSGGELVLEFQNAASVGAGLTDARAVAEPQATLAAHPDPVLLEIYNRQFAAIAEQMGHTLRQTSTSVNVKERLDFSCAIFTATGDLVVNAPHIPVHLGAMGETVKGVLADNPDLRPGDVFVTNDPFRGGSHLPDVTVVTPIHDPVSQRLLFFTASRAHHAEIGGVTPGSMPPFSQTLEEEGVLIRNLLLARGDETHWAELRRLLSNATYPSRDVETNVQDIAAQVAANRQGQRDLLALMSRYGAVRVEAYMRHIQFAAEQKTRAALRRMTSGRREFVDHMDDGTPIAVSITITGDEIVIDFHGSGEVSRTNLNANRAIVTAAVMYAMRCLIAEDIPLNQGVLTPVKLVLPHGVLNPLVPQANAPPSELPAIVGGNVEVSQRVVDVLLGALDLAAASQGTMNNFLFGDGTFGYYETICGGAGATRDAPGTSAVHTHMTNTRLTDPEVIERRFPVLVREFSIRRRSGGRGQQSGGDGVVRRFEFLRPLDVSIVAQRRGPYAPYGLHGGEPGSLGENHLFRAGAKTAESLPARVQLKVAAGDVLELRTPGGGGWGPEETADRPSSATYS